MSNISGAMFVAALICLGLAEIAYIILTMQASQTAPRGRGGAKPAASPVATTATLMSGMAFAFLTVFLIFRTIATGHGPVANMYEFSVAFTWGIVLVYLITEARYRVRSLGVFVLPVAMGLMWYASTIPPDIEPLVPALQNSVLLTVHVAVAIVAYGGFAVAFAAAVLYLAQLGGRIAWLPDPTLLDEVGYRTVIVGFPAMGLVIILGAMWANVAWGRYWGWDPKETASLVTWLIYGGYLHTRAVRGWRGTRAAVLLLLGFAAVLMTYFGNLFFGGLHSYGGV